MLLFCAGGNTVATRPACVLLRRVVYGDDEEVGRCPLSDEAREDITTVLDL